MYDNRTMQAVHVHDILIIDIIHVYLYNNIILIYTDYDIIITFEPLISHTSNIHIYSYEWHRTPNMCIL